MSRIISKKRALLGVAVLSMSLVAVAIAFYSTAGEGTGEGSTAANLTDLVISGDLDNDNLVPGGEVPISGEIDNPNTTASAHVGTVTGVVDATSTNSGTCADDDFSIDNVVVDEVIAPSGNTTFSATIEMANDAVNSQDGCKNADIDIDWSAAE